MPSIQLLVASRSLRRLAGCLCALAALGVSASGQTAGGWTHKPVPTKIDKQILVFPDAVVVEQWPHTLKLVNPPQSLKLLNPGQCIRIGIVALGDDRDSLLEKTQLSFRVAFAGQAQDHALAPFAGTKRIKPEGLDEVMQVTAAAHVEVPPISMVSMGASADRWCVPEDAQDGTATIDAEIESPAGHQKQSRTKILIESFETGGKHDFKDDQDLEDSFEKYYRQPNPARLIVLLRYFTSDAKMMSTPGTGESTIAFLAAALKANPIAAKDFMTRVSTEKGLTRAIGLIALRRAGYDIAGVLEKLSSQERTQIENLPRLPDPSDLTPDADSATRLDMSWGEFSATGALAPLENVTRRLAWRSDYDIFDKMRKIPNHAIEWTPVVARATTYSAAGWALGSFQRTDPLAADYIEFLIASPDTPEVVKTELRELQTNPAFKWQDKK
jgi:hypothetical protein